ncbi:MAG: hypothetical protein KC442_18000 [Thermomicrobiales bacterium]|nr:hypothetical protein [Thermomicrobiales bacterium]
MDQRTFDLVARTAGTRRGALWGTVALLLGLAPLERTAEAGCKKVGAKCHHARCCQGSRCKRGRCRCKRGLAPCQGKRGCGKLCAGQCCDNCFALANGPGEPPLAGTEFCCGKSAVCHNHTTDLADDDCCLDGEVSVDGKCCCNGCRGTEACGGVCCNLGTCCNGACCGTGQICAQTAPGVRSCVAAERTCDTGCYPGETCWDGVCCTADRRCLLFNPSGPDIEKCCDVGTYCHEGLDSCCKSGVDCTTGKKVRIRV